MERDRLAADILGGVDVDAGPRCEAADSEGGKLDVSPRAMWRLEKRKTRDLTRTVSQLSDGTSEQRLQRLPADFRVEKKRREFGRAIGSTSTRQGSAGAPERPEHCLLS